MELNFTNEVRSECLSPFHLISDSTGIGFAVETTFKIALKYRVKLRKFFFLTSKSVQTRYRKANGLVILKAGVTRPPLVQSISRSGCPAKLFRIIARGLAQYYPSKFHYINLVYTQKKRQSAWETGVAGNYLRTTKDPIFSLYLSGFLLLFHTATESIYYSA